MYNQSKQFFRFLLEMLYTELYLCSQILILFAQFSSKFQYLPEMKISAKFENYSCMCIFYVSVDVVHIRFKVLHKYSDERFVSAFPRRVDADGGWRFVWATGFLCTLSKSYFFIKAIKIFPEAEVDVLRQGFLVCQRHE